MLKQRRFDTLHVSKGTNEIAEEVHAQAKRNALKVAPMACNVEEAELKDFALVYIVPTRLQESLQ